MREIGRDGSDTERAEASDIEEDDGLGERFRLFVIHLLADVGERTVSRVIPRLDGAPVEDRGGRDPIAFGVGGVEGEIGKAVGGGRRAGGSGWEVLDDAQVDEGRDLGPAIH